ncbi:Probable membrane-associated kinase regulator 6 [Striga hermonthica]|uniref:Probable membrane-associated kinase regulator 6 n=1 Tax=Striga hermonthica TaxID=68872 RepID=A0A9N7MQL2_STRHE|nr:Probable membrane-associated kinase regulator 6 [Striga hermonthica]
MAAAPPNDSFSYGWLAGFSPSSGHIIPDDDENTEAASKFIEMDPRLPPSKRFSQAAAPPDLCFDFPISGSPIALVPADQLISNGFLVPLVPKKNGSAEYCGDKNNFGGVDDNNNNNNNNSVKIWSEKRAGVLGRCRRLSARFLERCFRCLVKRVFFGCGRDFRSEEDDRSGCDVRMRWEMYGAAEASPRASLAWSSADDDWRRSCDSESSIYEAVMHCKRTQGI